MKSLFFKLKIKYLKKITFILILNKNNKYFQLKYFLDDNENTIIISI